MPSSLANDTAVTADDVGKSLTAAAVSCVSTADLVLDRSQRPSSDLVLSAQRVAMAEKPPPISESRGRDYPIAPPICDGRRRTMRWRKSSRIDPAIAADGKTGDWALTRVKYYTIPIYPGHGGRRRPTWERQGERNVVGERLCTRTTCLEPNGPALPCVPSSRRATPAVSVPRGHCPHPPHWIIDYRRLQNIFLALLFSCEDVV